MEFLRTHDAARDCLAAAVPGGRVAIERCARGSELARSYTITVPRFGREPLTVGHVYALPVPAESLRRSVATLLAPLGR